MADFSYIHMHKQYKQIHIALTNAVAFLCMCTRLDSVRLHFCSQAELKFLSATACMQPVMHCLLSSTASMEPVMYYLFGLTASMQPVM